MQVRSFFIGSDQKIQPLEVEIKLLPGLPQIQFLGNADSSLKESAIKIKSALKHQGFKFPRAHQVVINLRPGLQKKKSAGLDLAIAYLILIATDQIPEIEIPDLYIYGELNLNGELMAPERSLQQEFKEKDHLISGQFYFEKQGVNSACIENLGDFRNKLNFIPIEKQSLHFERPTKFLDFLYTQEEAELLKILSWGGHHALFAGPPGCGKTTLAHSLQSFLAPPTREDFVEYKNLFPEVRESEFFWRPVKAPHHSNTTTSLIGGGTRLLPGDLSRAHTGLLIMDEFLEFKPQVLEALRQPLENGTIQLSRGNLTDSFMTRFQLVATTNLCHCGKWTPRTEPNCGYSRQRCLSVRHKLSGPLLDRFEILFFKDKRCRDQKLVKGSEILEELQCKTDFFKKRRSEKGMNFADEAELPSSFQLLIDSDRRFKACRRIALTLCELDGEPKPTKKHFEKALEYSWQPFQSL